VTLDHVRGEEIVRWRRCNQLVVLTGTDPLVWRRIQVPERYSFWDLHVAIQDAMGWLDYHLHEFRLLDAAEKQVVSIGIPTDEDPEDRPVIAGWEVRLSRFFERRAWHAPPAMYAYDFDDDWEHVVVHEGIDAVLPQSIDRFRKR